MVGGPSVRDLSFVMATVSRDVARLSTPAMLMKNIFAPAHRASRMFGPRGEMEIIVPDVVAAAAAGAAAGASFSALDLISTFLLLPRVAKFAGCSCCC